MIIEPQRKSVLQQVGIAVAHRRRTAGLTQEALAEQLNVTTKRLQVIEQGRQETGIASLHRIAQALDLELHELLDFRDVPSVAGALPHRSSPISGLAATGWGRVAARAVGGVPIWDLQPRPKRPRANPQPPVVSWARAPDGDIRVLACHAIAKLHDDGLGPSAPAGTWVLLRYPVTDPKLRSRVITHEVASDGKELWAVRHVVAVALEGSGLRIRIADFDGNRQADFVLTADRACGVVAEVVDVQHARPGR